MLILLNKIRLLTLVTKRLGKYFMPCKSLILLKLTNLPYFPPYRGYRGRVSNPSPPTPITKINGAKT